MRISFDLDGVITNSEKWFFRVLSAMRSLEVQDELLNDIEILYYSTRSVRYNPYLFLSPDDEGIIITARKPISTEVTEQWLRSNGINLLQVIYIDQHDTIDWSNYAQASLESGERKAHIIRSCSISAHFDNNPFIIRRLRIMLPEVAIIQVGGEPCLSSM